MCRTILRVKVQGLSCILILLAYDAYYPYSDPKVQAMFPRSTNASKVTCANVYPQQCISDSLYGSFSLQAVRSVLPLTHAAGRPSLCVDLDDFRMKYKYLFVCPGERLH